MLLVPAALPHSGAGHPPSNNRTFRRIDKQATFQTFASMTGGRAYFNSNDLAKGFHDAVEDSSTSICSAIISMDPIPSPAGRG